MTGTARAVLRFEAAGAAEALRGALHPETLEPMLRARASVRAEGGVVEVVVEAEDAVALRAGVNSYLRVASAAVSVLDGSKLQ